MEENAILYDEYDKIANLCAINIWKRAKHQAVLNIYNFNPKDKSHWYILKVGEVICEIYGYKLNLKIGIIQSLILKYKTKIKFKRINKLDTSKENSFNCEDFCNYMNENFGNVLPDIYKCYYERNFINEI